MSRLPAVAVGQLTVSLAPNAGAVDSLAVAPGTT